MKYVFPLFLCIHFLACTNNQETVFTGFEPLNPSMAIHFEKVEMKPVFLDERPFGPNMKEYFQWEVFELNKEHSIVHYCTSRTALDFESRDSIFIQNRALSLSDFYENNAYQIRILEILRFEFEGDPWFLLIGADMMENGNRLVGNIIFLVKEGPDSSVILCPPLNLRGRNTFSFLPYYLNDFNRDKRLDFLQADYDDTISMYSVVNDTFVKQPEFIKLFRKEEITNVLFIDKKGSDWPYVYFKSDSLHPGIKHAMNHYQERDFDNPYYPGK